MKTVTIIGCCLGSAAAAFYFASMGAALMAPACSSGASDRPQPPPVGEQFSEGPVLVRLTGLNAQPERFIF